jgi:hypothetical protein
MNSGDKVICIDDSIRVDVMPTIVKYYKNWVNKDQVYTVRHVVDNDGIVDGVLLEEIHNSPIYIELIDKNQEPAFGMFRFALLQEDKVLENAEYFLEIL